MEKLVKQILTKSKPPKWSWPEDLIAKGISLLFAVFLWYFVSGEDRVDMNVQVPVEIINIPHHLVISNQYKTQLDVTVSGARGLIRGLDKKHVSRSIDLSSAVPGNLTIKNELNSIKFPRGITPLRITPKSINLHLDELIQREIPINYITKGKLEGNYELISVNLTPSNLSISGPNEVIGEVKTVDTMPIDIGGLSQSTTKQVQLDLPPEIVDIAGGQVVTADIKVKLRIIEKEIANIPISITGVQEGFYAQPSQKTVKVLARLPHAYSSEKNDPNNLFKVRVDVSGLAVGTHDLELEIDSKLPVIPVSIQPNIISVEIWEKKNKKRFK